MSKAVDTGKARPNFGTSKHSDKDKYGVIPAPAGGKLRYHELADADAGPKGDRNKSRMHGHHYPGRPLPGNK